MLGWLQALPDELFHFRPVLSVYYAGRYCLAASSRALRPDCGTRTVAGTTADRGERPEASSANTSPESFDYAQDKLRRRMVVADEEEFHRLPVGSHLPCRKCPGSGRCARHVKYARRALDLVPEEDHLGRGAAADYWDSHIGRMGISRPRTGRMPTAWQACSGPGTSPTPSVPPLAWRIYGLLKVVSTRQ